MSPGVELCSSRPPHFLRFLVGSLCLPSCLARSMPGCIFVLCRLPLSKACPACFHLSPRSPGGEGPLLFLFLFFFLNEEPYTVHVAL